MSILQELERLRILSLNKLVIHFRMWSNNWLIIIIMYFILIINTQEKWKHLCVPVQSLLWSFYPEFHLCPCICPGHPLALAWSNCHGCQAKTEKKQGSRGPYPGRIQRTKVQWGVALGVCFDYNSALSPSEMRRRGPQFSEVRLTNHWFSSIHVMFIDPNITTENPDKIYHLYFTSGTMYWICKSWKINVFPCENECRWYQ